MKNKITKQEYLEALEIVEAYHNTILEEVKLVRKVFIKKTLLSEFLLKASNIPALLNNSLSKYKQAYGDLPIENVTRSDFLKVRGVGGKSWASFEEMREEYLENKFRCNK